MDESKPSIEITILLIPSGLQYTTELVACLGASLLRALTFTPFLYTTMIIIT